jgi:hypothetical protein
VGLPWLWRSSRRQELGSPSQLYSVSTAPSAGLTCSAYCWSQRHLWLYWRQGSSCLRLAIQCIASPSGCAPWLRPQTWLRQQPECGLTCRSTGGATAGQPGRATALVHHRPHGPAVLPRRPGYLYVRPQRARSDMPLITDRVSLAREGQNDKAICRMRSGWAVMGDVQFLPGYCLLLPDPVVPSLDLRPNMSVNRRRHGRPARPCDRLGPSSAARPGRPAASPRLPLR